MRRGFTLVELIVVLGILSIVTAIVAPSLFSNVRPTDLEQSASELARLVSRARALAVEQGTTSHLTFVPRERRYVLQFTLGTRDSTLTSPLQIAPAVVLDDARPRIAVRFDAIGRATPERLVLRSGDRLALVSVDPWSGLASVAQR